MLKFVRRRTGELVPFQPALITQAIFAAAKSVGGRDLDESARVAGVVIGFLDQSYGEAHVPDVEQIQDLVEQALIKTGHASTAKAYILYRAARKAERAAAAEELLAQMRDNKLEVTLPDGQSAPFDLQKIAASVAAAADGLKKVNIEAVVHDTCKNLYAGVKIPEIERSVINAARTRIENHPEYSLLAARLLWQGAYKTVFGQSTYENPAEQETLYRSGFAGFIEYGIANELLDPRLAEFDLPVLAAALHPERDLAFDYLGAQTVFDRYLLKTVTRPQRIAELPQWLWLRVAMGLAIVEKPADRTARAIEFYEVLSQFLFVSSTPTLFNSGTTHPQMSSCYVNTVPDSLSGIFKTFSDNALLSKWAGGIGTDWSRVRATNAFIKGTNGASQGIIPFLKIFNDVALAVNQGGKRKGAMAAYLEVWHGDIEEFLEAKKNTGDERRRLHDVNTVAWVPDLFMKRVLADAEWTLFSPNEVPELHDLYGQAFEKKYAEYEAANVPSAKKISAKNLWRKMLTMLYETGHPWITFKDAMNVRNPQSHAGVIHSSNLCTEIALNTNDNETAVCNLGSLNLAKMLRGGDLDAELIEKTVRTGMRMLDNVIDNNFYPTPEAKASNARHRPVGLGVMGYTDALYQLDIAFDSDAQLAFADRSMEMLAYFAFLASSEMAAERGTYESYAGSKWSAGVLPQDTVDLYERERGVEIDVPRGETLDWKRVRESIAKNGMRNSCCLAIAPTATISNIVGSVPCVEPTYKNIYMKENLSGSFVLVNEYLVADLESAGLWNETLLAKIKIASGSVQELFEIPDTLRAKYKETFEIGPEWIIRAAARRTKWIDQSASTNIFLKTSSGKILHDTYMLAWQTGLKTTYYLRTLSESQVAKTVELPVEKAAEPVLVAPTPEVKFCKLDDPTCEACQ